MRRHLHALKIEIPVYSKPEHSMLFKNLILAKRDRYHLREGYKEDMPFICLIKADLHSKNKLIKGQIGGRDDERSRKDELLSIKFEVYCDESDKVFIEIDSTDRTTSYEESLRLVQYCLSTMSRKSVELTTNSSGGNAGNKKGYYPQTAEQTGMFATFDSNFNHAVIEQVLPEEFREFFREIGYNLMCYPKKKVVRSKAS